tara:strand:- start:212 stop:511 length:300 start_codon:yes stop_codon:yes gene_type:complete
MSRGLAFVDASGNGDGAVITPGMTDATARTAFAVTTSDTARFAKPARGLYIGGSGNIVVVLPDNTTVTFTGVLIGSTLPVACIGVNSTSTTATNIVALV